MGHAGQGRDAGSAGARRHCIHRLRRQYDQIVTNGEAGQREQFFLAIDATRGIGGIDEHDGLGSRCDFRFDPLGPNREAVGGIERRRHHSAPASSILLMCCG